MIIENDVRDNYRCDKKHMCNLASIAIDAQGNVIVSIIIEIFKCIIPQKLNLKNFDIKGKLTNP